jgi:hypothetical protein
MPLRALGYVNHEGIQSASPGLAFFSQPWGTVEARDPTPTGLRQLPSSSIQNRHNPFQDLIEFLPRAGGRNPFGIHAAIECSRLSYFTQDSFDPKTQLKHLP